MPIVEKFLRIIGTPGELPILKADEDAEDTTTSTSWQQAVRFTKTLAAAKYILIWSAEISNTNTVQSTGMQIQKDDADTIALARYTPNGSSDYLPVSGVYAWQQGSAGSVNFDFDIRTTNGSSTAKIRRKRMIFIKVKE